jgi:hypothetical protein
MKAGSSSGKLVTLYQFTRRHHQDDGNLKRQPCEDLKFRIISVA